MTALRAERRYRLEGQRNHAQFTVSNRRVTAEVAARQLADAEAALVAAERALADFDTAADAAKETP